MAKKQLTVTATLTRNYGPITVSYSTSEVIDAEKYGDVIKTETALTAALLATFDDFEANSLPKMRVPQAKGGLPEAQTKPSKPQWYIAKEMYMTINDGKKYYFVRTTNNPKTNKFGAAVYWDRMTGMTEIAFKEQCDQDTMKFVFAEGVRVLIEDFKGKPRAIQIAHKDTIGEG